MPESRSIYRSQNAKNPTEGTGRAPESAHCACLRECLSEEQPRFPSTLHRISFSHLSQEEVGFLLPKAGIIPLELSQIFQVLANGFLLAKAFRESDPMILLSLVLSLMLSPYACPDLEPQSLMGLQRGTEEVFRIRVSKAVRRLN